MRNEAIEECYNRFGRHLNPDISKPILNTTRVLQPYDGRCARTGIEGPVVDWLTSDGILTTTYVKLIWMMVYQRRPAGKNDYRMSFGQIAITPSEILSTQEWAARSGNRIPDFRVAIRDEILRKVVDQDRYLFLSFGKNVDRNIGDGFRYSYGSKLEVNGELAISKDTTVVNHMIDLELAQQLASFHLDWTKVYRFCMLRRNKTPSPQQHEEILALHSQFGRHAQQMVKLSRRVTSQDIRIGQWLDP